jgi:peptide chain release factor 3
MVTLPGVEGEMGIFPMHVPLMTQVAAGELVARKGGQDSLLAVGEGFVESPAAARSPSSRTPDAGKTTLTEKLLLYGGAVQLAGSVTARKNQRATTSDWMELERQRGISVSSTVLQFDYRGSVNLLDTPGHKDFSEDTYRVLTAVDAAVMVIDAGKGIESQTRKLFEVCRRRGVPIFTFMNKLDRPPASRSPARRAGAACSASAPTHELAARHGRLQGRLRPPHVAKSTSSNAFPAAPTAPPSPSLGLPTPASRPHGRARPYARTVDELEMLDGAGAAFDTRRARRRADPGLLRQRREQLRRPTPARRFVDLAPAPPAPRRAAASSPTTDGFSGFVFKIQANMDPRHRDRIAFVRICSGRFERDMNVHPHPHRRNSASPAPTSSSPANARPSTKPTPATSSASSATRLPHRRHPGRRSRPQVRRDPPLHARVLRLAAQPHHPQFKRFREGLDQLLQEGVVQSFIIRHQLPFPASPCSARSAPSSSRSCSTVLAIRVQRRIPTELDAPAA